MELRFKQHEDGYCQKCGAYEDVLYTTMLSDGVQTQTMVLCRNCARRIKARVDEQNGVSPQSAQAQQQTRALQPRAKAKSAGRKKLTKKQRTAIIVASVVIVLVVAASIVLWLMPDDWLKKSTDTGSEPTDSSAQAPGSQDGWIDATHLYFGSYPQTEVKDSSLIEALNAQPQTWKSYGYYSGTGESDDGQMRASDFMQYCDVVYADQKYRGVRFTQYRPAYTGEELSGSEGLQARNGYYTNTTYWFRYDPLRWRVLDRDTGLVLCERVIDSQPFNNIVYYSRYDEQLYGNANTSYYANNYTMSSIRAWLTDDIENGLLYTAFSDQQKENIVSNFISNDSIETQDGFEGSEYDAPETNDRVFLLSANDIRNTAYGFNGDWDAEDPARQAVGTDYAKSQGLFCETNGCAVWQLRSAGYNSDVICFVYHHGAIDIEDEINGTWIGIRPAMRLNLQAEPFRTSPAQSSTTTRTDPAAENYAAADVRPAIVSATTVSGSELGQSNVNASRTFKASNTIDGSAESCWCANTDKTGGSGAALHYQLAEKATIRGIRILNGNLYRPYDDLYSLNGQVENFVLRFSDDTRINCVADYNSGDTQQWQTIYLDEPVTTDSVLFVVLSSYTGSMYSTNVCLTEFEVF